MRLGIIAIFTSLFSISCSTTQLIKKGKLVHTVYFDLIENVDEDMEKELNAEFQKLGNIKYVQGLTIGSFQDVGDSRALKQYDYVIQMHFDDQSSYTKYQNHPIHIQLKKDLKKYLAGPPASHDFTAR